MMTIAGVVLCVVVDAYLLWLLVLAVAVACCCCCLVVFAVR